MTETTSHDGAPLRATAEQEIAAPPEVVWDTLADIARWPEWMPGVRNAVIESGADGTGDGTAAGAATVAVGTTFRWKASSNTIRSELVVVERATQIAWTGTTIGIRALHTWVLEPRNGRTFVRTEESWRGPLAKIARKTMEKLLKNAIDGGMPALATEAERRAAA